MGGMRSRFLKIFLTFSILSMTSLALSSMSGFVAELIVFFDFLITKRLITFVMAIGMILTPIYSYLC
jgi:NAD(P)H-quinone oxidoreductase subunit 4